MSELIKLYNPANAGTLTPEQLHGLQELTSSQIRELATAYPNATMQRPYLLIIDKTKPVHKQLPALSSFENLYNLRERNNMKQYVPYAFRSNYKPAQVNPRAKKVEIVDLSDTELMFLPGFKKAVPENKITSVPITNAPATNNDLEVKVTKVKRQKK
jgi:hypothetical protein